MSRRWFGSNKVAEEAGELVQEVMKLQAFPDGKHPGRKRSIILSTEDECADIMAAVDYFIDRNRLDRKRIEKRRKAKYRKFEKWWGKITKPKSKKKSAGLK
jgi:NTP pyrophosphatase (non-canonical NTP hydrolase)